MKFFYHKAAFSLFLPILKSCLTKILKGNSIKEQTIKLPKEINKKFPKEIIAKVGTYNLTLKLTIRKEKKVRAYTTHVNINPILLIKITILDCIILLIVPFFGKVIMIIISKK